MDEILFLDPATLRWFGVTAVVADLAALASIWHGRHSLRSRLVWTAIVAVMPILGAVAWFALGRERRHTRRS